jgi:protein SERAC1
MVEYTRGIIFLGTPHEGSSKIKWAETGQRFLKLLGKNTSNEMVNILQEDSVKLAEIGESLSMFLRYRGELKEPSSKIEVTCFFEEYESSIGMVC